MNGLEVRGINQSEVIKLTSHDLLCVEGNENYSASESKIYNPLFGGRKVTLQKDGNIFIIENSEVYKSRFDGEKFRYFFYCLGLIFLSVIRFPYSLYLLTKQVERRTEVLQVHHVNVSYGSIKPGTICHVYVDVANMHEECNERASYVSQAIHGTAAHVMELVDDEWIRIKTVHDSYGGLVRRSQICIADKLWMDGANKVRVKNLCGMVYAIADTEKPAILRMPYGSEVRLLAPLSSSNDRWREIILPNGTKGFIQQGDIEEYKQKSIVEIAALAKRFIGLPYVWGGSSSRGYDCSGFVQMLYSEHGISLPRDSRPQSAFDLLDNTDLKETIKEGDLVFFGKTRITHVGFAINNFQFIHSGVAENNPTVNISETRNFKPLLRAIRRIK